MEITSPVFYYFLGALLAVYWLLPAKQRPVLLLAASYFLYSLWDLRFLPLLLGSTAADYLLGRALEDSTSSAKRKTLLSASVLLNAGILSLFKYREFLLGSAQGIGSLFGFELKFGTSEVLIPLGISFYTFHSISYMVDVYRGRSAAIRSFPLYALYVAYFPKLVSGPIERASDFTSSIECEPKVSSERFIQAIKLVLYGLFLKLCVSDRLDVITSEPFSAPAGLSSSEAWTSLYAYSFQIFADFLGYTCIARGISRMFGIELSRNFYSPYLAETPRDFWRRWHITLSSWFRDYVYLPLGGKRGPWAGAVLLTMAVAGLWHGPDWKFVLWGIYHGALICLQRLLLKEKLVFRGIQRIPAIFITFHLVSFGWILFKAPDLSSAVRFAGFLLGGFNPRELWQSPSFVWLSVVLFWWAIASQLAKATEFGKTGDFASRFQLALPAKGAALGLLFFLLVFLGATGAKPFVYYNF